jgi:hypothetical protein
MVPKTILTTTSSYSTGNVNAASATTPQHDVAPLPTKSPATGGGNGDAFSVLRGAGNLMGGLLGDAAKAGIIIIGGRGGGGGQDTAAKAGIIIVGGRGSSDGQGLQQVRDAFDNKDNDLQSQDKLGNFEIQSLMSDYNEASAVVSSVQKKLHDTQSAVIGKI